MIAVLGKDEFYKNEANEKYFDIDVPLCFVWLFNVFVELYNASGEQLTWCDIDAYTRVRDVVFTQSEIDVVLKMKYWAESEAAKLREDGEG